MEVLRTPFPKWLPLLQTVATRFSVSAPGAKLMPFTAGGATVWAKVSLRVGPRARVLFYMPPAYGVEPGFPDGSGRVPRGLINSPVLVRVEGEEHFVGLHRPAAVTWDPLVSPVPNWLLKA